MKLKSIFYLLVIIAGVFATSCGNSTKTAEIKKVDSTATKLPEQLKQLNDKIQANPNDANLYYQRGKYFYDNQQFGAGLIDLQKAINIDSSKTDYYITLSDLYFVNNQTSKTKAALEKCLALDVKNAEAMLKLAELYLYVRKHEESIKYINMALKENKYNAKAYFMKGMNFKELKDTAKAISSMQTAVEQDQRYYSAYMQLGMLCSATGNPLAVEYYKNAIKINPSGEALYSLGKYYQDARQFDKAMEAYNDLVNAEPKNVNGYYNMGVIELSELKKYDLAVNYFATVIGLNPKYIQAYYGRGLSYQAAGNKAKAKADFQACVDIDPQFEPAAEALKKIGGTLKK